MQTLKQYGWLILLMGAGAVIAWFAMPPQRRNMPGLLLACVVLIAILAFSGCRGSERPVQPDRYYLSMPSSQQEKDRALAEMKKDGYIK